MRVEDLDTPALVVDLDRLEANLVRAQGYADAHGLRLRPHVKTHKLPRIARRQVELGAVGITCQKLGEAEAMADGGLADILVTFNVVGAPKLARLAALRDRAEVAVSADDALVVEGYAGAFRDASRPLPVLVECDTGAGRCGVPSPEGALALARRIAAAPGLRFGGLMTYPPRGANGAVGEWLARAVDLLAGVGLPPPVVSTGGSPGLYSAHEVAAATEHRPGTYVYSDRMQVAWGLGQIDDCALSVLATVASRPAPGRAVLDAGSKALAADLAPVPGHGHVLGHPEAVVAALFEEHAVVDVSACPRFPPIGETVRVVPNHACVVTNLFDAVHLVSRGEVVEVAAVTSRGRMA